MAGERSCLALQWWVSRRYGQQNRVFIHRHPCSLCMVLPAMPVRLARLPDRRARANMNQPYEWSPRRFDLNLFRSSGGSSRTQPDSRARPRSHRLLPAALRSREQPGVWRLARHAGCRWLSGRWASMTPRRLVTAHESLPDRLTSDARTFQPTCRQLSQLCSLAIPFAHLLWPRHASRYAANGLHQDPARNPSRRTTSPSRRSGPPTPPPAPPAPFDDKACARAVSFGDPSAEGGLAWTMSR